MHIDILFFILIALRQVFTVIVCVCVYCEHVHRILFLEPALHLLPSTSVNKLTCRAKSRYFDSTTPAISSSASIANGRRRHPFSLLSEVRDVDSQLDACFIGRLIVALHARQRKNKRPFEQCCR